MLVLYCIQHHLYYWFLKTNPLNILLKSGKKGRLHEILSLFNEQISRCIVDICDSNYR